MPVINQNNQADDFDLNIRPDIETVDTAALCRIARDISLMSERAYLKFRETLSLIAELTSLDKCNAFKKQINQIWPISFDEADLPAPEKIYNPSESNKMGIYIAEPMEKIKFCVPKVFRKMKPLVTIDDNTFKIMICHDVLQIKKTHVKMLYFLVTRAFIH